jgi:hypothetical protein
MKHGPSAGLFIDEVSFRRLMHVFEAEKKRDFHAMA